MENPKNLKVLLASKNSLQLTQIITDTIGTEHKIKAKLLSSIFRLAKIS